MTVQKVWRRRDNENAPEAEDLARAGFFFVGGLEQDRLVAPDAEQVRPTYRSDATKCFHCNTTLHSWEPNDDVWTEHAKWSPKCGFLIAQKGLDFVIQVRRDGEENNSNGDSRHHRFNDIVDTPPEMMRPNRYQRQEPGQREEMATILTADFNRKVDPIPQPDTEKEAAVEYENLVKQIQCKVCLGNRSSVLFLPCRHISVCSECASRLPDSTCPLCRAPIEHMIDAYIS